MLSAFPPPFSPSLLFLLILICFGKTVHPVFSSAVVLLQVNERWGQKWMLGIGETNFMYCHPVCHEIFLHPNGSALSLAWKMSCGLHSGFNTVFKRRKQEGGVAVMKGGIKERKKTAWKQWKPLSSLSELWFTKSWQTGLLCIAKQMGLDVWGRALISSFGCSLCPCSGGRERWDTGADHPPCPAYLGLFGERSPLVTEHPLLSGRCCTVEELWNLGWA